MGSRQTCFQWKLTVVLLEKGSEMKINIIIELMVEEKEEEGKEMW